MTADISRLEPVPEPFRVVSSVRATLHVRTEGRVADAIRDTLPDRFVVDVYVDGGLEPAHRAVVMGVARSLAAGVPAGLPVTVEHPVPATRQTHLVQYVINADGAIPESSYENNHASKSFGYYLHPAGVTFARTWDDEGPFRLTRIWSPPGEQDKAHAWVYVEYAGGPLKEGPVCSTPTSGAVCPDRDITGSGLDPTPSLRVWLDSPDVACVGPGGFFEPTPARGPDTRRGPARLVDGETRTRPIKRFFCFARHLARVPFGTKEVIVEGRVHGVSTRTRGRLDKTWHARVIDPYMHLPELAGQVERIDFLDGLPLFSARLGRGCGNHPRVRFRVRNEGPVASPPVVGHVWISPPSAADWAGEPCPSPDDPSWFAVDIPPIAPGASYVFDHDFSADTSAAPGATVNIDVDPGFEAVEVGKTNNRARVPVPVCTALRPEECR